MLSGATAHQRQPFLIHSFRYFSNKRVKTLSFVMTMKPEAWKRHRSRLYTLVSSTFECKWRHFFFDRPPGQFHVHTFQKLSMEHTVLAENISHLPYPYHSGTISCFITVLQSENRKWNINYLFAATVQVLLRPTVHFVLGSTVLC